MCEANHCKNKQKNLHDYSPLVLSNGLQGGKNNFVQRHKRKIVYIQTYVYSWSSGTVNGNTPIIQLKGPAHLEGEREDEGAKYAHQLKVRPRLPRRSPVRKKLYLHIKC